MLYALCVKSPKLYGRMAGSFVSGFTSFQRATLKSHDQSNKHLSCVKYARLHGKSASVAQTVSKIPEKLVDGQGTIDIMVSKMNRDELEKIYNLFSIAYMIGKYNKPLSDMQMLMDKCGVDIMGLIATILSLQRSLALQ